MNNVRTVKNMPRTISVQCAAALKTQDELVGVSHG